MRKFSENHWGTFGDGYMDINAAADKDGDDEYGGNTTKPPPTKP